MTLNIYSREGRLSEIQVYTSSLWSESEKEKVVRSIESRVEMCSFSCPFTRECNLTPYNLGQCVQCPTLRDWTELPLPWERVDIERQTSIHVVFQEGIVLG